MRCDQYMGLSDKGHSLISNLQKKHGEHVKIITIRQYQDGREKRMERDSFETSVSTGSMGNFCGMFGDSYELTGYFLLGELIYQEYIQAEIWSSGPMFFIALKDAQGNVVEESLWPESELR